MPYMKKILVAAALALFATASFAKVENSKHDFNYSSTYSQALASRCSYCHVPHAAKTWANVALWATNQASGGTFEFYSNTDYKVTSVSVAESQTCLACHADGTIATTGLKAQVAASANVGFDLRNDHPIGAEVALGGNTSASVLATVVIGRHTYSAADAGTVECAVCHSVHGTSSYTIQGRKLLYGSGNSGNAAGHASTTDFCAICHTR
jgi:hypothetical protein